jgi:effector-binding domain-containing protein
MPLLYVTNEGDVSDSAAIGAQMGAAYGEIMALMQTQGIAQTGQPVSLTNSFSGSTWNYDAGIPVDRNDVELGGNVKAGSSPSGKALRFVHTGAYDNLAGFAPKVDAWLAIHDYTRRARDMDQYVSDPGDTPVDQLITHVIIPVE